MYHEQCNGQHQQNLLGDRTIQYFHVASDYIHLLSVNFQQMQCLETPKHQFFTGGFNGFLNIGWNVSSCLCFLLPLLSTFLHTYTSSTHTPHTCWTHKHTHPSCTHTHKHQSVYSMFTRFSLSWDIFQPNFGVRLDVCSWFWCLCMTFCDWVVQLCDTANLTIFTQTSTYMHPAPELGG